jgi:hypothetical protein
VYLRALLGDQFAYNLLELGLAMPDHPPLMHSMSWSGEPPLVTLSNDFVAGLEDESVAGIPSNRPSREAVLQKLSEALLRRSLTKVRNARDACCIRESAVTAVERLCGPALLHECKGMHLAVESQCKCL